MEVLEKTIERKQLSKSGKEVFFERIYEGAFPVFARFAAKMNASREDTRDVFQDALVVFYEKSMDPAFVIAGQPEAYVVGIAKHLWIRKFHVDRHSVSLDVLESHIHVPADFYPSVNEMRLLRFLEVAGKKCLELLRKFYYEKTPVGQIASALGYRNGHSVSVQKFKCIGKMKDAIKSKSMNYEDFIS
jgi:DNA-directed RNA polymerase specialized sigma24 family protein